MNELEKKCLALQAIPESNWFARYKGFAMILDEYMSSGKIECVPFQHPIGSIMGAKIAVLRFAGEYYILFSFPNANNSNILECFSLEKLNTTLPDNILSSDIVLGSDESPERVHFLPMFFLKKTKTEIRNELSRLF